MKLSGVLLSTVCGTASAVEQHPAGSTGSLFQVLFGLVAVLALMAAAAWALKRFGVAKNNSGTSVKIVGGISIGTRERILVVEVANQWIVVGVTPGRISTLSSMPKQEQAPEQMRLQENAGAESGGMPANEPAAKNFASWLKQTIEKRNDKSV
jgi:flagellar protein FliO/FliZ